MANFSHKIDDHKYDKLCDFLEHHQVTVAMLQECGLNWDNISQNHRLPSIFRDKKRFTKCKAFTAHNVHTGVKTKCQWGGTAVLSMGNISHYAKGAGRDLTGLGRWCWTRFQGRNGITLRYVSVYGPCDSKNGETSVRRQHIKYLNEHNDNRHPKTAFLEDLEKELKTWLAAGDQVVVGGDFNLEVTSGPLPAMFARNHMHNMVFCLHDPADFPSTSDKATVNKRTVDGIFGTANLIPIRAGYLELGEFLGNHHPIWFDVSYQNALGHRPPKFDLPSMRRLQLHDPKCVARYTAELKKRLLQHRIPARLFALERSVLANPDDSLTPEQAKEANAIDNLRTQCMKGAEKKCRKLRTGKVPYSPKVAMIGSEIRYWDAILNRILKKPTNARTLKRLKKKAGVTTTTSHLSIEQVKDLSWDARTRYREAKSNAPTHRRSHLESLPPKQRNHYLRVEEQRRQGTIARSITGKLKGAGVSMVTTQNPDGQMTHHTTKRAVENAIIDANKFKYSQSTETPPMQPYFVADFGYTGNTPAAEAVLNGTYVPAA